LRKPVKKKRRAKKGKKSVVLGETKKFGWKGEKNRTQTFICQKERKGKTRRSWVTSWRRRKGLTKRLAFAVLIKKSRPMLHSGEPPEWTDGGEEEKSRRSKRFGNLKLF